MVITVRRNPSDDMEGRVGLYYGVVSGDLLILGVSKRRGRILSTPSFLFYSGKPVYTEPVILKTFLTGGTLDLLGSLGLPPYTFKRVVGFLQGCHCSDWEPLAYKSEYS